MGTDDVQLPSNQAEFDEALMIEIAERTGALGPIILQQFRSAKMTDRNGSRVGCFTQFEVPDGCDRIPDNAKQIEPLLSFGRHDTVRAPLFDAISLSLADLWPLDEPLGFNEDPQALYAGDR